MNQPTATLFQGDCAKVMDQIPDGSIDLTVTSPPYDNLRTYNGFTFDFEAIARQLYRVTKPGGVVVWVVGDATINGSETGTSFKQALGFMECGFALYDTMIYRKVNFIPLTHKRYEQAFEYMFILSKGSPKAFNPIMERSITAGNKYNLSRKGYSASITEGAQRRRDEDITVNEKKLHSNIFEYTTGGQRVGHPAPFPDALAMDQILSWSNQGDTVLDPMCGSGTTGKKAVQYRRNFIGIDISGEYLEIAKKRIDAVQVQLGLEI